jgi:hypothetical protein
MKLTGRPSRASHTNIIVCYKHHSHKASPHQHCHISTATSAPHQHHHISITTSAPPHQHCHISIATTSTTTKRRHVDRVNALQCVRSVFLEMACTPISKTQFQSTFFFIFCFLNLPL